MRWLLVLTLTAACGPAPEPKQGGPTGPKHHATDDDTVLDDDDDDDVGDDDTSSHGDSDPNEQPDLDAPDAGDPDDAPGADSDPIDGGDPACAPTCDGTTCADDGCGELCACAEGTVCTGAGTCLPPEDTLADCAAVWECRNDCLELPEAELEACREVCKQSAALDALGRQTALLMCSEELECWGEGENLTACVLEGCGPLLDACFGAGEAACNDYFSCSEGCVRGEWIAGGCLFACSAATLPAEREPLETYLECLLANDYCEGVESCCDAEWQVCADDEPVEEPTDPFSCQGACGGEAPGGCACDAACLTEGDCCLDYLAACSGTERDCSGEFDECVDDCIWWAFFGGYEVCVQDCSNEYLWCEAMN